MEKPIESGSKADGKLRLLVVGKAETAASARAELLDLLARVDAGEVTAFFGIAELSDGCYQRVGSSTMSRLQQIGALFEAAVSKTGE